MIEHTERCAAKERNSRSTPCVPRDVTAETAEQRRLSQKDTNNFSQTEHDENSDSTLRINV